MSRRKQGSLFHQINKHMNQNLNRIGQSKHEAKRHYRQECEKRSIQWNPAKAPGIHSIKTMEAYKQTAQEFSHWMKKHYPEVKNIQDVERQHTKMYLEERQERGKSPWTVSKDMSAFNKIFNHNLTKQECGLQLRSYRDAERSRVNREHDRKYNPENYRQQIDFAKAFGVRRESIYRGNYQVKDVSLYRYDGKIYVSVIEKGGRYREAPCLDRMQATIEQHFPHIPERDPLTKEQFQDLYNNSQTYLFDNYTNKIDNHAFRHEYARNLYEELQEQAPPERDITLYRGYDREILQEVSEALGHSRVSVVVEHYLR
ncbi:site-specific integrase [Bacillus sp. ISL-55]|uniref:site-specific integrase n=1 Tax=Bacillus sp. ISL-55 TaxID=2819134 RepID=UPI001BEB84F0|nr:site-specific integrase [Bacillus sp. ISL-55]MBT2695430.1 site-specific integrase [Bacillus sp. ISL-55]